MGHEPLPLPAAPACIDASESYYEEAQPYGETFNGKKQNPSQQHNTHFQSKQDDHQMIEYSVQIHTYMRKKTAPPFNFQFQWTVFFLYTFFLMD